MNYHAHIYFDETQLTEARALLGRIKIQPEFKVVRLLERPVGPHAKPMIEVHFHRTDIAFVEKWLVENRNQFSVLIHPDTGDDYADHDQARISWLGEELKIDFSFFDLVKKNPEKALH